MNEIGEMSEGMGISIVAVPFVIVRCSLYFLQIPSKRKLSKIVNEHDCGEDRVAGSGIESPIDIDATWEILRAGAQLSSGARDLSVQLDVVVCAHEIARL
ncbi:hypothetical protein PFISCL1PPCAC_20922, partial [Pristionchus fissidentatus]